MSVALDQRGQRRARVNAAAAHIAAREPRLRALAIPPSQPLRPSARRRLHAGDQPRVRARRRTRTLAQRTASIMVLLIEVAGLAAALSLPMFTPTQVSVDGAGLLTETSLLQSAEVPSASIFTIDGEAIRERLQRLPMVRGVTVTTELPSTVHIAVTEWKPVLRLAVPGRSVFIGENGAAVDVAATRSDAAPSVPVIIDGRAGSPVGARGEGLDPRLVQLLVEAAAQFPGAYGCSVAAFQWQPDGLFSIWTDRGWRAILGHLDTADQVAAVPAQLAALGALRGQLNLTAPQFGYVNLENVDAPAVGGAPGLPAEVTAAADSRPAQGVTAPPVAPAGPTVPRASAAPAPTAAAAAPPAAAVTSPPVSPPAGRAPPTQPQKGQGYIIYIPQASGQ
ncbi:MAG: cell division protein FtsQ/DivIB [Candidatus Dormibacteria bacterium]